VAGHRHRDRCPRRAIVAVRGCRRPARQGLLESALARPLNKFAYGEADLAILAAAYGYGIARNHPFVDGNKRMAFAAIIVFLGLNDLEFKADPR
jgi:death-on-curing protein